MDFDVSLSTDEDCLVEDVQAEVDDSGTDSTAATLELSDEKHASR